MKILEGLPTFTEMRQALKSKERNLIKDAGSIYLFQMLSLGFMLIPSVFIARILGPAGKGILDLFTLLVTFIAQFGLLGINSGLLFFLANKKRPLVEVHGTALTFSVIFGLIIIMIGIGFQNTWQHFIDQLPAFYTALGIALAPVILYGALWPSLMTGVNRAPFAYKIQCTFSLLGMSTILILWRLNFLTIANAIILAATSSVLTAVVGFLFLGNSHHYKLKYSNALLGDSLKYGFKTYPGFIANWLHFRADQLMISWFVGTSGVGIYSISVNWSEILWLIGFAVMNAGLFRISSEKKESAYILTKKLFKANILLTICAAVILAFIAKPLLGFLYGKQYTASVLSLVLLLPGIIAWDAGRVLSQYISLNRGKPQITTIASVIGVIVNIGLNFYAIPKWGINGAAVTTSISYILVIIIIGVIFQRLGKDEQINQSAGS